MAKAIKPRWSHSPKHGDLVMVFWLDASSSVGWFDSEYPPKELLDASKRTTGFFWKYWQIDFEIEPGQHISKETMLLVSSAHHEDFKELGDPHQIPVNLIWNVKEIKQIEGKGE